MDHPRCSKMCKCIWTQTQGVTCPAVQDKPLLGVTSSNSVPPLHCVRLPWNSSKQRPFLLFHFLSVNNIHGTMTVLLTPHKYTITCIQPFVFQRQVLLMMIACLFTFSEWLFKYCLAIKWFLERLRNHVRVNYYTLSINFKMNFFV